MAEPRVVAVAVPMAANTGVAAIVTSTGLEITSSVASMVSRRASW
jgi:hypothetical protein